MTYYFLLEAGRKIQNARYTEESNGTKAEYEGPRGARATPGAGEERESDRLDVNHFDLGELDRVSREEMCVSPRIAEKVELKHWPACVQGRRRRIPLR